MLQVAQSNLRFWEKKFPQLKPKRSEGNTRLYSEKDIETVKQIILLKKQNLKLIRIKKDLSENPKAVEKQQQILECLQKMRAEVQGILRAIDN